MSLSLKDAQALRTLRTRVPVDAAGLLAAEPPERIGALLQELPRDFATRVALHLPPALRPVQWESALQAAAPDTVADLTELTAGVLRGNTRVAEAVEWLRRADEARDLTYLYVVDEERRLQGLVVMRDLLLAEADEVLFEVMIPDPFVLRFEQPLDEAIKLALVRHYPVYPVCDDLGHFRGVVRGYRLFEHQARELSAQAGQMVGVAEEERVSTGVWQAFRLRHPWLQLNLLTAFMAGLVVSLFEDTIAQIVALAAFLPILAGQSGNNGCQTLAITLRGITLGDADRVPVRQLLRKEIALGALNGVFTGMIAAGVMWWFAGGAGGNPQAIALALVILLAMTGACMASGFFGVMVPLILRRLGADPSTASSIFLTTGTDIAGMGLMLLLASTLVL